MCFIIIGINVSQLTKVVLPLLVCLVPAYIGDHPEHVTDDDERGRQRRPIEVLVDEAVTVETPYFQGVLLDPLKRVTGTEEDNGIRVINNRRAE